jgi:intein/homing endonuclease
LESEHKISEYLKEERFKIQYRLAFVNQRISERLQELGLTERKSTTKPFPQVPEEYVRHFIRGYFDGNVSFSWQIHKKDKHIMRTEIASGSERFLEGLRIQLIKLGLPERTVKHRDRKRDSFSYCFDLRYETGGSKKLYEIMYKDATIYIKRKKEYFDTYLPQIASLI